MYGKAYVNNDHKMINCFQQENKNSHNQKLQAYILEQERIQNNKVNEQELKHIESNENKELYCETYSYYKIENSFLQLSSIMNIYSTRNKQRAFGVIKAVSPDSRANHFSDNDLKVYNLILEKLKKGISIVENKFQVQKSKTFSVMYIRMYEENVGNDKYSSDTLHFDKQSKINQTRLRILELEEQVVMKQKGLKKTIENRDILLLEVKHEDLIKSNDKVKDRSQEMMLQDKKVEKYEKENKEIKTKLEKKEKEVKKFMSEMNKILQLYDDNENSERKIQTKKAKEKIAEKLLQAKAISDL